MASRAEEDTQAPNAGLETLGHRPGSREKVTLPRGLFSPLAYSEAPGLPEGRQEAQISQAHAPVPAPGRDKEEVLKGRQQSPRAAQAGSQSWQSEEGRGQKWREEDR